MNEWKDELMGTELLKLQYLATWCEQPTQWKRCLFWKRLKAEREQADRGWDGWMASPIQWTELGEILGDVEGQGGLSMGLQRVRLDLVIEQQKMSCWKAQMLGQGILHFLFSFHLPSKDFLWNILTEQDAGLLRIVLVSQSRLTLCNPMDCSPPGSSAHRILQPRILEWVALPSSRGSSPPGIKPMFPALQPDFFTLWATRETYSGLLRGKDEVWSQLKEVLGSWVPGFG